LIIYIYIINFITRRKVMVELVEFIAMTYVNKF